MRNPQFARSREFAPSQSGLGENDKARTPAPETLSSLMQKIRWIANLGSIALLALLTVRSVSGQEALANKEPEIGEMSSSHLRLNAADNAVAPIVRSPSRPGGVAWRHLFLSSITFLAFEHAFRCATEQGTRDGFGGSFLSGYGNAVGNLHGWADGDPFLVNYIGHPMQGSVTGFVWQHNDRAYRDVVFGKNARYWKAKLRGTAFSYLYSVQFEIGPVSEASLGHIQSAYPQQGFVDHVVTPLIGLGWTVVEDSLDRYVIRSIESHTSNPYYRVLARGLNPSRAFANVLGGRFPWDREDRPSPFRPYPEHLAVVTEIEQETRKIEVHPPPGVAPFEVTMTPTFRQYIGAGSQGSCAGGGGSGAIRIASDWQIVVDVQGCKLTGLGPNLTGDSLNYMAGPRWTPQASSRWSPHAQVLVGGAKLTEEKTNPELRKELLAAATPTTDFNKLHTEYTQQYDTNGFALLAGIGVDYKVNKALAFRVASLDYTRSWTGNLNQVTYDQGLQFTSGLIIRMGTW